MSPHILQYPNLKKQFIVTVDASRLGCGAILSQNENGNDLPIHFASKAFTASEKKKPIIELELLAIYFAINQFRPYLYGTNFKVKTDHRPLVYLFNMKYPSSKLTKIRLDLSEYSFTIEYIKGESNVCADALSCITIHELKTQNSNVFAITRAMTWNQKQESKDDMKCNEELNLHIFDKFSHDFNKNSHKIRTQLLYTNQKINKFCVNTYNKFKKKIILDFVLLLLIEFRWYAFEAWKRSQ